MSGPTPDETPRRVRWVIVESRPMMWCGADLLDAAEFELAGGFFRLPLVWWVRRQHPTYRKYLSVRRAGGAS